MRDSFSEAIIIVRNSGETMGTAMGMPTSGLRAWSRRDRLTHPQLAGCMPDSGTLVVGDCENVVYCVSRREAREAGLVESNGWRQGLASLAALFLLTWVK